MNIKDYIKRVSLLSYYFREFIKVVTLLNRYIISTIYILYVNKVS